MHARGAAKALERVTDDQENVDKEDFLLRKPMFYCAAFTNDLHETGKVYLYIKKNKEIEIFLDFW